MNTLFTAPMKYFSNVNRYTRAGNNGKRFSALNVENGALFIILHGVH